MTSSIQGWRDTRADFSDSARMFGIAQQGISNAGTVFGQLRASILDQEQKAVDNVFREKQLAENSRQFGLTNTLETDRFGEVKRSNTINEEDTDLDRTQKLDIAKMENKTTMAGLSSQAARVQMEQETHKLMMQDRQNMGDAFKLYASDVNQADNVIKDISIRVANAKTSEEKSKLEEELKSAEKIRKSLTANQGLDKITTYAAQKGTYSPFQKRLEDNAVSEIERTKASITQDNALRDSYVKGSEIISKNVTDADYRQVYSKAYDMAVAVTKGTRIKPEEVANTLIQTGMQEDIIGSGQSPTSDLKDFISNPTNKYNPIYQQLMLRSGKDINKDTSTTPLKKIGQPENLSTLSDEALNYKIKETQEFSIEPNNERVKTRYDQLLKADWGDIPKNRIPENTLKTLEERALRDTKASIKKEREQVLNKLNKEVTKRNLQHDLMTYIIQ